MLDEQLAASKSKGKKSAYVGTLCLADNSDNRHRKSEKEEDEELLKDEEGGDDEAYVFEESPSCKLRKRGWALTSRCEGRQNA